MRVAVIAAVAAVAAAAIAAWATLRARRKPDGRIRLVDVMVADASAVLAEPEPAARVLDELAPDRPVLDIAVHNDGGQSCLVRRVSLDVEGLVHVPALDLPLVVDLPGGQITDPLPVCERRLGPSGSYHFGFPLREGRHTRGVNQQVAAGEDDRFLLSLTAREAVRGQDFYRVTLSLDCGRTRRGKKTRPLTWKPITVAAYGLPDWETPEVIRERLTYIADRAREVAPGGGDGVCVIFNAMAHPLRTAMTDYVDFYEARLKVLEALLRQCGEHLTDRAAIETRLTALEAALGEVAGLHGHATAHGAP
ncbi:hypothetical protein JQK87_26460 [Streptomyces sp. G44]|uniref:hypothetical protein n=1 Tax=Streptomyces sp. G44 TaxID=2807632 RepID=UPI0019615164|nr:hypothetical protein [Streptomyces sp. G44]MBM7171874.1 hypothetical protein [Streptomyces sp. G44]